MLNQALSKWSDWGLAEKPKVIKVFNDGLNHHTGLIKSGDKQFVLKVFEHSFERTMRAERWAAELDLSPRLHMEADNVALYEFIEDQGYTPKKLSSIAVALKHVHQSEAVQLGDFDLLRFCDVYLANAGSEIQKWHSVLMPVLIEFIEDPTPWTFCHNDLVTQNCLFKRDGLVFIDWEFAQRNNPWFDLASIVLYFELDQKEAECFLASYRSRWQQPTRHPIFISSQIAVLWCDLLWHTYKFGTAYRANNIQRFEKLRNLAAEYNLELFV